MAEYIIDESGKRVIQTSANDDLRESFRNDVLNVIGAVPPKKPDGTDIDPITTPPARPRGSAQREMIGLQSSSGLPGTGATFNPANVGKITQDPTKTGLSQSFDSSTPSPSGPPFDNILDQFSTYTALWTLACLEPAQYNNPLTYRSSPNSIKNVIISSAGRYDEKRTPTINGSPEYYIDNVVITAGMIPVSSGNSNSFRFTFDVYEPYSMGLFLQSLQSAAIAAGYPNYLGMVPYLFKLDFVGNVDDGSLKNTITAFTKYFTIQITNVTQKVNASGSNYTLTAVPFHHSGYSDTVDKGKTSIRLTGGSVSEVLSSGENSLSAYLNSIEQEQVQARNIAVPDVYEIVFPVDASDNLGVAPQSTPFSFGATVNPKEILKLVITNPSQTAIASIGGNAISESSMNFSAETGGNYVQPKEQDTIDEKTGITVNEKVKIDPNSREFRFEKGDKITRIIQKVILVSNYATAATDPENLDEEGMVNWFRVDLQIQLLDYDNLRGVRARKFTYRVLPYLVDGTILKNPSAPTAGLPARRKIIAKRYDYIYSGQNNNILNLDLEFNSMFFTSANPRPLDKTGSNNPDTNNAVDVEQQTAGINAGNTTAITSASGASTVGPDENTVKNSPVGKKSILQQIADVFQTRFQTSTADMVNVEMEILGDPYFLADSGVNSNYFSSKGINSQITGDNSLNYEGSDIFIYIAFRTPVEPNLSVSGEGGLYEFPNGGKESPYSGIYKVVTLENSFSSGKFTQTLRLIRPPGQENDLIGQEAIVKGNLSLYGQLFSKPAASTPAADTFVNDEQGNLSSLDRLLGTLSSTVDTVGNIAANVVSGNIGGVLGGVSGVLNSVGSSNEAARTNLRPSSQRAGSAPQTTSSAAAADPLLGSGNIFDTSTEELRRKYGV